MCSEKNNIGDGERNINQKGIVRLSTLTSAFLNQFCLASIFARKVVMPGSSGGWL